MDKSNDLDNNDSGISIYFSGLTRKERTTFDRVIAFNVKSGLQARICDDISNANLVIISEEVLSQIGDIPSKTVLVVCNQASGAAGDYQLVRPLVITRVMSALGDAIKQIQEIHTAPTSPTDTKAETTQDETVESSRSGHHALVIDDSGAIRKQLELELRDAGFTADFADCGEKALEMIKQGHFDLIFLDIIMPGIDGYETCKRIRSLVTYKKTPIIMLSGKTKPLDEVQGIIAGATTYLTKPVKANMLQEALTRVKKWIDNFATGESKNRQSTAV